MMLPKVLVVVFVFAKVAAEFPEFISRCSKSDPNLDKCLLNHSNLALPYILNGVPELYLPSISNFRIGPLDYDATEFIHFHNKEGVVISNNVSVTKMSFNPENNIFKFSIRNGYSKWRFNFIANGTILGKPILEKGYSNMTLYNTDLTFEAKFESKTIDGIKYYQISNYINSTVEFEKFEYKIFEQESVKKTMTWKQRKIFKKSLPAIEPSIAAQIGKLSGEVIIFILNTMFLLVPQDEVFLP